MKEKRNTGFVCIGCKQCVQPAPKTSRNHCPWCFLSVHVDGDLPGDRLSDCHGQMIPIEYEQANGLIKIMFQCLQCGKQHRNKAASDDEIGQLDIQIKKWKEKSIQLNL